MLLVNALAGTGKTTTAIFGLGAKVPRTMKLSDEQKAIVKLMRSFEWGSCAAQAFNKDIAEELKGRVPEGVTAATCNSFGNTAWLQHLGGKRVKLDAWKTNAIFREMAGSVPWKERTVLETAVCSLVNQCKNYLIDPVLEHDRLLWLASRFDIDIDPRVVDYVHKVFKEGLDGSKVIDFNDQVFLPIYHGIKIPKYDLVLVDECLPGWTPVMLYDETSIPIDKVEVGMLVRSYDTITGVGKNCKVTAIQKILNQKPLVKVKVKHTWQTGTNRKTNFVVCTIDHKIWTSNRGWVPAGQIQVNDMVIVETAAKTTQKGKITGDGRKVLSDSKLGNTLGVGVPGRHSAEQFNVVKGGNGKELSLAHRVLLEELGSDYVAEFVITTSDVACGKGYANHYKIDIADPKRKIAIEVDGPSHSNAVIKAKDAKKQKLIEMAGWTVYRYTNQQAIQNAPSIACKLNGGTDCPKPAKVVSVDPVSIRDSYVYDITVEECHNFYANGILVHNCQDLNSAKQEFAFRMAGKYLVAIGDPNQAVYGFSGSDSDAMQNMENRMEEVGNVDYDIGTQLGCGGFTKLPLTITRRNPKSVVREANVYVPELRAAENAEEGIVDRTKESSFIDELVKDENGRMILCRVNAPLASLAFRLIARGRRCYIQGKDIGSGIKTSVKGTKEDVLARAVGKAIEKIAKKIDEASKKPFPDESKIESLNDRVFCIKFLSDGCDTIDEFCNKVDGLFKDAGAPGDHQLSSVHKSKGLEKKHVCIYKPSKLPFLPGMRRNKDGSVGYQAQQEKNLAYVAYTRSMHQLTFVDEDKKADIQELADLDQFNWHEENDNVEEHYGDRDSS
jgi:hypothetical protein